MSGVDRSGTFKLGDRVVKRLGYGAMRLSGPGIFGPPKDRDAALAVLRQAVASGVNHIDTSDYCGPHTTNQLIHDALHPYPPDLVIVTKIGARRGDDGSVMPAYSLEELTQAVHDNLRNLGRDVLDVVNFRNMLGTSEAALKTLKASLIVWTPRRRRSRSRGYCVVRRTSFSSPARRLWHIFEKTSLQRSSICGTKRSGSWTA